MKNVLLVTIQDNTNIGNRLQNYAIQRILESTNDIKITNLKISERTIYQIVLKIRLLVVKIFSLKKKDYDINGFRMMRFEKFSKKYIHNYRKIKLRRINRFKANKYDYAIVGSDQVWNDNFWDEKDVSMKFKYYYLQFIEKDKRISYAPSFGFNSFNTQTLEEHKKGLQGINCLSCREESMIPLIENVVKKNAKLVLDPTCLLTKQEWIKIASKPLYTLPKRYIVVYFLGKKTENIEAIERLAKIKNADIIDVYDKKNLEHYYTSPDEFVWLVNNSVGIITDSFHGVAFSIIMNKPFTVFKRKGRNQEDMFNRIETLLNISGIKNSVYHENDERWGDIDYDNVNYKIEEKRKQGIDYIKSSLGIK